MRFKGNGALFFHHVQQFADHQNQIEIILGFPFGPRNTAPDATETAFEDQHTVCDQLRTDTRAHNNEALNRRRLNNRRHLPAGHDVAAEYAAKHDT